MGRIFMSGAEAGSLAVLDGPATCSISAVQKRTGSYSFYFDTSQWAYKELPAPISEFYVRIAIYPVEYTEANGGLLLFYDSAGDAQLTLTAIVATGLMKFSSGYIGGVLATGTHPLVLNTWQCLEVYIRVAAVGGRCVLKVDGVTEIDFTGDTLETANINVKRVYLIKSANWCGMKAYVDDIAVNDTAGAVNNSWIGRGGIYGIVPEGVGTYTDLHASAGNAWDCINEVPPDDADYVYDDTVNQKSVYALTALTPITGTIDCINVIMRAKLDAAGAGSIARLIRSNGVDSQGVDVPLDVSAKTIQDIIETDPGAAPGTAWTIPAANAMQAGATVR